MTKKMLKKIRINLRIAPKHVWILAIIILVGIFLRTYNFHDWLRFNPDQSRDAAVVSAAIKAEQPLPLLGPKAGGTEFKLGPAFYYLQYLSAKAFGDYPDKMAYPDLLFSILSIPLLFFLLRKYFNPNIALALTAIYSLSFYAIRYSRFAWNPNSTPFWTMLFLYALLEILDQENSFDQLRIKKNRWSVFAGIAMGIGVQLHTFLLAALPALTILIFGYLAFQNSKTLKYFLVILLVSLFLNVPQLTNEFRSGGANVKAFFGGIDIKKEKNSVPEKIIQAGKCYAIANTYILSSVRGSDNCAIYSEKDRFDSVLAILTALFFIGGLGLTVRNLINNEANPTKKRFIGLFLAYTGLSFLIIIPVAYEVSMRYFLILVFMPFVLLGFWIDFLVERVGSKKIVLGAITGLLVAINLVSVQKDFAALADPQSGGNVDVVYLGEIEKISSYIQANSAGQNETFLDGNNVYLFKSAKSIAYLAGRSGIKVSQIDRKDAPNGKIIFYLGSAAIKKSTLDGLRQNFDILDSQTFGRFSVLKLQKK